MCIPGDWRDGLNGRIIAQSTVARRTELGCQYWMLYRDEQPLLFWDGSSALPIMGTSGNRK